MNNKSLGVSSNSILRSSKSMSSMIDVTNAGGNFWVTKTSILLARHGGGKFVIDGVQY